MKKIALILFATIIFFASHAQKHAPAYKTLSFNINGCRIDMVYVQGGEFTMGCDEGLERQGKIDEIPFHPVVVGSFYMGRYEVTQRLWKAIMGYNPSNFPDDDRPVEQVSYEEVHTFIQRLNTLSGKHFRLPTEAEWEYAARGGVYAQGNSYAGSDDPMKSGWGQQNSGDTTHAVGGLIPNELGLYDMTGNVWEWCQDWYYEYEYGWRNRRYLEVPPQAGVTTREEFSQWLDTPLSNKRFGNYPKSYILRIATPVAIDNPKGPATGDTRVGRGGSWCDTPENLRTSYRNCWPPNSKLSNLGFRLVMILDNIDTALGWMPGQQVLDSIVDGQAYYSRGMERLLRREQGVLEGLFSVSPDMQVRFSKGNLQYNSGAHQWRFADSQTDYIGDANLKAKKGYPGWIDLFGWGTSGYHDKFPSQNVSNPAMLGNGENNNIEGTSYDWGVYNSIANGGQRPGLWRTLTVYEWNYLFTGRPNAHLLHSQASIVLDTNKRGRCVEGIILLPDDWFQRGFDTIISHHIYRLTLPEWNILEYAGAVFLPAAGTCYLSSYYQGMVNLQMIAKMGGVEGVDISYGNTIPMVLVPASEKTTTIDPGFMHEKRYMEKVVYSYSRPNELEGDEHIGYYWSTVHYDKKNAMALTFAIGRHSVIQPLERLTRCSVRLVQDVAPDQPKSKNKKKRR